MSRKEATSLGNRAVGALEAAAESAAGGEGAVGTFDVVAALIAVDPSEAWDRIQLRASWIDAAERARFRDLGLGPGSEWRGTALTYDAAEGLRIARELADAYDLQPVPAGALALGMVWQADSGAARALLEEGELSHAELLDLLQDELLGARLEEAEPRDAGDGGPARSAPRADETTATSSGRPLPPPPDLSDLPAEDPVLRQLLADAEALGRRSPSGPWLFARGGHLLELHDLGGLSELERKRAAADASVQLAFREIPGAVPVLSVDREADWLIVETPRLGEDLERHMAGATTLEGRLPASFYGDLLAEAAGTLDAMHERGLVHRNVRPSTLVFDPRRGELKVAGFAISALHDETELDRYRSPETFGGEIGPAMDQYALGVVARELLTVPGSPPLTDPIRRVLQRATAPRPADRFATIAELGSSLVEAIATEAPRSLAERVANLSPAIRGAMAPTAIGAISMIAILTAQAPGAGETVELVPITSLLTLTVLPALVFGGVALAGAVRGRRRALSLGLAANPLVPLAIFLVLLWTSRDAIGDDGLGVVMRSLLYAYGGCALLAPARPYAGAWLIYPLAAWGRRKVWPVWARRLVAATLTVAAVAALAGPTVAKLLWNNFDFPRESASSLGPLVPVWNLRAALGSDDTAYACDRVMSAAAAQDRQLCRKVAHYAGVVQRNDPASQRKDTFGAPGTFESFQVQELPAPSRHRLWLLWTPAHKAAGSLFTRGPDGKQLDVMVTREAPATDPEQLRSTWLYEVVWNGSEWRVAEYRACRIGDPGTGKRPADCVIRSTLSWPELRRTVRAARGGSEAPE